MKISPDAHRLAKAQSQENWQLRALKLQLLQPDAFALVAGCLMGQVPQRSHTQTIFLVLKSTGVLERVGMGEVTPYRMTLLIRACRSHMRQCARRGYAEAQARAAA